MVGVVIALEDTVLFDHPGDFLAHVGPQHARGVRRVVVRGKLIANVVEQRSDNPVDIGTVEACASRRLQRVFEPSDLVAAERVVEPLQYADQAIG